MSTITPEMAVQMAEYIQTTDEIIGQLKEANEQLTKQASELQKQAGQAPAPDAAKVSAMVEHLVAAKFLAETQKEAAKTAVMRDPLQLIEFLDKLATNAVQTSVLPKLGRPADAEAPKPAPPGEQKRASDEAYDLHFGQMAARM